MLFMSKESIVFLLGLTVLLSPFLGIPNAWKDQLLIGAGVCIMLLGYVLRRAAFVRSLDTGNGERKNGSFVESV
jgi:hypothetical protein